MRRDPPVSARKGFLDRIIQERVLLPVDIDAMSEGTKERQPSLDLTLT